MSDFLGLLAARQLGAVEAIKPRLPARYEPPPAPDGDAAERPVSSTGRLPVQVAAAQPAPMMAPRAPSTAPGAVTDWRDEPAGPDHEAPREAAARPLVGPAVAGVPEGPESPRIAAPAAPGESVPAQGTGRSITIETSAPTAPLVAMAAGPTRVDPDRPAPLPATATLVRRSEPAARPFARLASAPLPAADRRPRPTAEPPVVRVSIGRIDVRPAPGAERAAAPRRGSASPGLPLEDYLERRYGPSRGAP